jgi:hypothetical protein
LPKTHASAAANGAQHGFGREALPEFRITTPPRRYRHRLPEGLLTVDDLVQRGEARSTVYRYVKTHRLPAHRWRGRIVVSEKDYSEFLAVTPLQTRDAMDAAEEQTMTET